MSHVNPIELALKAQAWSIMETGLKDPKMPEAAKALRHCMNSSMKVAKSILKNSLTDAAEDLDHSCIEDVIKMAKSAGIKGIGNGCKA